MCKRALSFLCGLALGLAGLVLGAQSITVPNTFTNGTVADATQVNANFSALAANALNRGAGVFSGTATPSVDNTIDLGSAALRFANVYGYNVNTKGNTTLGDAAADTVTVNGTITSNVIATDNTYDIGASGATRFRDLFLARNAVIGGTLDVGGSFTGPPRLLASTIFETAGRFGVTNVGGGTATFGSQLDVSTSATITSSSVVSWAVVSAINNGGVFTTFPGEWSATTLIGPIGTDVQAFLGLGSITIGGAGVTYTSNHIGFKIVRAASGATDLKATQADGATETASSSLTTLAANDSVDLFLRVVSAASVQYWWRKNGSAWSSVTTLTTNVPTAATVGASTFGASNAGVATATTLWVRSASYTR